MSLGCLLRRAFIQAMMDVELTNQGPVTFSPRQPQAILNSFRRQPQDGFAADRGDVIQETESQKRGWREDNSTRSTFTG